MNTRTTPAAEWVAIIVTAVAVLGLVFLLVLSAARLSADPF
jgi:hypothetical protein